MTANLPRLPASPAGRFGVLVAFWIGFTLFTLVHAYLTLHFALGREYRPEYAVSGATQGLIWIAMTPLVIALVRRFPLAGARWISNTAVHFAIASVMALLVATLVIGVVGVFDFPLAVGPNGQVQEPAGFLGELKVTYTRVFLLFMLLWFGVVAAATAAEATRVALAEGERAAAHEAELREREVRSARLREHTAQLEGQLSAAQLDALRMQLNPHFLFNTLHAVSTLMARDVDGARRMISDLSNLLRRVLDGGDSPEVPLDDELDLLGHYLDIERTRFADRLSVEMDVEPGTRGALVPTLILQPLVENAIQHGIAPRGEGGRIEIAAHRSNGSLVVHVCDDGPGMPEGGPKRQGVGLQNTRDRLAKLYGEDAALTLRNRPGGGLDAEVKLPYHAV